MKAKDLIEYVNKWYDPEEEVNICISLEYVESHKNYPTGPIKHITSAPIECMIADEYAIAHGYLGLYADIDVGIKCDYPKPYNPSMDELPF